MTPLGKAGFCGRALQSAWRRRGRCPGLALAPCVPSRRRACLPASPLWPGRPAARRGGGRGLGTAGPTRVTLLLPHARRSIRMQVLMLSSEAVVDAGRLALHPLCRPALPARLTGLPPAPGPHAVQRGGGGPGPAGPRDPRGAQPRAGVRGRQPPGGRGAAGHGRARARAPARRGRGRARGGPAPPPAAARAPAAPPASPGGLARLATGPARLPACAPLRRPSSASCWSRSWCWWTSWRASASRS